MPRVRLRPVLAALAAAGLILGTAVAAEAAEPTGTVRGVLQDEAGGLLVRDETKIRVSLFAGDELATPTITTELQSMEMGAFEITGVPVGRYAVKFEPLQGWDTGRAGEWWGDTRRAAERAFIEVSDGGVVELEARLMSTVQLSGTVTGRETAWRNPGPHISVSLTSGDAELDAWLPWSTTDVRLSERYGFRVVPGSYELTVTDRTGAHKTLSEKDIVVNTPTVRDVSLQTARASISGMWGMRTAEGVVPVREGWRELYKWTPATSTWKRTTPCGGASGTAFLDDCLTAGRYKLAVSIGGVRTFWGGGDLQTAPEIVLASGETLTGLELVADEPAKAFGIIGYRASNGKVVPFNDGQVDVWRKTGSGQYVPVPDPPGYHPTAGDGEFWVALAPGTYVFKFGPDASPYDGSTYYKGARFFEDATQVHLGLGEQRDLGTIILPKSSFEVDRISGPDRFATAAAVSKRIVASGTRAPVVYLTNAFDFPDALAAGPAAMRAGGVILPVDPDALPGIIASELGRLRPERVVIAGGKGAVSESVRAAVKKVVPDAATVRLGGASRYETADLIVRDAFAERGSRFAIVATGATYPDALAAGPAAGHLDAPVLLVDGARGLGRQTKATIAKLGITDVYIAGGKGAVSADLEAGLRSVLGKGKVKRLAGSDRVFTAIEVNDAIFTRVDYGYVASSSGFADALAGAPLAATRDAPLYLSAQACINAWTVESLRYRSVAQVTLLGGTGVLGSRVAALRTCD
jgi:putative cell wall-binding protein